jgi:hypothetical protein
MNISGTSDYPATVYAKYTTPTSSNNSTQKITAQSASDLATIRVERANQAKADIDLALSTDQYPPNYKETLTNTTYY